MLNWKDHKHTESGGADYVTHKYCKHFIHQGHHVTLFSSIDPGLLASEIWDGIRIIRQGSDLTVRFWAFIWYLRNRRDIDIVIDQIHGLPFFTPLYVKKPILAYIHEVAGEIWHYSFMPPIANLGLFCESQYFKFYKNIPFLTHSDSTKKDLLLHGISSINIFVTPPTIDYHPIQSKYKYIIPTLIYMGRLDPMKRVELFIDSLAIIAKTNNFHAIITGKENLQYEELLRQRIHQRHLEKKITLIKNISEREKRTLLARSWIHIHPSVKEGYGLTVLEAAQMGTPTICFDVAGLSELVRRARIGLVVQGSSSQALATEIIKLLNDGSKLKKLSRHAYLWAQNLPSWIDQTRKFERILEKVSKKYYSKN
jgi:glycosyltransferase involved in cell wall biosynthesis